MQDEIYTSAQGLSELLGYGAVDSIGGALMEDSEQGYSGAEVVRKRVHFADGKSRTMVFKHASWKERCVMERLTCQKQCSPAAFSSDITSDQPKWMALEDLGLQQEVPCHDPRAMQQVAEAIAAIHFASLNQGAGMPWLPKADRAYWQEVTTTLSLSHFEKELGQDAEFARRFEKYFPQLQMEGERFVREMTALSAEAECMTLTHGDLQMQDGSHIYWYRQAPRIIDFGFARYAPFYVDLNGWFDAGHWRLYYASMVEKGFSVRWKDFAERARAAARYNGFLYLYPALMAYRNHEPKKLIQSICTILDGDFPEKRMDYSDTLYASLSNRLGMEG